MRASRLVTIVLALQARGPATAAELADRFGVSERTIHRDVEALRAAGVPVTGDRGPAGGYRLPGGYRTRLTGLTPDEAESLFLSAPADDLGLGGFLADAQLKLLAALPPEIRRRADRASQLLHHDRDGWFREREPVEALPDLVGALWRGRRVMIAHGDPPAEREVDPLGLVLKGPTWYLLASTPRGRRTFRVSRVTGVRELEAQTDRPIGFDLATAWAEAAAAFEATMPLVEVRVRVEPTALPALRDAADVRRADDLPASLDTTTELAVHFETLDIAELQLRALGPGVEVIGPPGLRDRLRAFSAAMAVAYGAP